MNESLDTPTVPPPGQRDATPGHRLDRIHAALQAAQDAEAGAERTREDARQALEAATYALYEAERLASAAARAWHRANGRIERLSKKGRAA